MNINIYREKDPESIFILHRFIDLIVRPEELSWVIRSDSDSIFETF